jgi:hypothetical protein
MATKIEWLVGALFGAALGVFLRFAAEFFPWAVGRPGPPWDAYGLWAAGGAILFAVGGAALLYVGRRHARAVAALAENLGYTYMAHVDRERLAPFAGVLPLRAIYSARNAMSGKADGVPFDMIDIRRSTEENAVSDTVVLLPVESSQLAFRLHPAPRWTRALGGPLGVDFEAADAEPGRAEIITAFLRHYLLRAGGAQLSTTGSAEEAAPDTAAVGSLFDLDRLGYFAAHPGWHVVCADGWLALWRGRWLAQASGRGALLADALELRRVLFGAGPMAAVPSAEAAPLRVTSLSPAEQVRRRQRRVVICFLWGMLGFFLGGAIGMGFVLLVRPGGFALMVPLFFGPPLLGFVLGVLYSFRRNRAHWRN